tara:strand:- start:1043 stop:1177 length:135 start_codon:yes stop_codon:yes gene_type:complete
MYINIEVKDTERKDYYKFLINGVNLGEWERSELRYLIEVVDNKI